MFDKYIIDAASVANTGPADAPTGFSFTTKLGYYRGLGLSMVEDLVSIDGEALPREAVTFDEAGPLSLDEMERAFDRRWAFGAGRSAWPIPAAFRRASTSWRCNSVCVSLTCRSPASTMTRS
jgi:hypothetical protein